MKTILGITMLSLVVGCITFRQPYDHEISADGLFKIHAVTQTNLVRIVSMLQIDTSIHELQRNKAYSKDRSPAPISRRRQKQYSRVMKGAGVYQVWRSVGGKQFLFPHVRERHDYGSFCKGIAYSSVPITNLTDNVDYYFQNHPEEDSISQSMDGNWYIFMLRMDEFEAPNN